MHLGRGVLSRDGILTLDSTHTTDRVGLEVFGRFVGFSFFGFVRLFGGDLCRYFFGLALPLDRSLMGRNGVLTFDSTDTTDSLSFIGIFGSDLVGYLLGLLIGTLNGCLVHLGRGVLSRNSVLTLDSTHTTYRVGLVLGLGLGLIGFFVLGLGLSFIGLVGRDLVGHLLGLIGKLNGCLVHLGRGVLSRDGILTFDGTHTADSIKIVSVDVVCLLGRRGVEHFDNSGGLRLLRITVGLLRLVVDTVLRATTIVVVVAAGRLRRRHDTRCGSHRDKFIGDFIDERLVARPALEGLRILASLGRHHDVDDGTDEHESRRERVDPDVGDQRGVVTAQQLDPEPSQAIPGDVQSEQASVANLESPIDQDQDRENQYIPQ